MADTIKEFVNIPQSFVREGTQVRPQLFDLLWACSDGIFSNLQFMNRCTKPDKKGASEVTFMRKACSYSSSAEFMQICRAVGLGFVVMGFIGYFVKLIHIPINHVVSACVGL